MGNAWPAGGDGGRRVREEKEAGGGLKSGSLAGGPGSERGGDAAGVGGLLGHLCVVHTALS